MQNVLVRRKPLPPRKVRMELARKMVVESGARAVTLSKVCQISSTDARNIYKEVTGHKSASGKTPESQGWYLQTLDRRIHTTLFLRIYDLVMSAGYEEMSGFIKAYNLYFEDICQRDTDLTVERAQLLVRMKKASEDLGAKGEIHVHTVNKSIYSTETNKNNRGKKIIAKDDERETDVMVFKTCRKCGIKHIASKVMLSYRCAFCDAQDSAKQSTQPH